MEGLIMHVQYKLLSDTVSDRRDDAAIAEMNAMADIFEGNLPAVYDKYFPESGPKHVVNLTRLAWSDLATSAGRLPDLRGEPLNNSKEELAFVGQLEKIGFGYLKGAEPSAKQFMWQLAWWMFIGEAVAIVVPDKKEKRPVLSLRDPRTCFPGVRKTAGGQVVELKDLLFEYELTEDEMDARGLRYKSTPEVTFSMDASTPGLRKHKVYEYIDAQKWMVVSELTAQSVDHGLGVVPGWVFRTFTPNGGRGLSHFKDQVNFMVAISQLMSMKIRYAQRLAHPITWIKGHEGTIEVGPDVINKLGPQGEMGQLQPPTQMQVDRDIEMWTRFSRILNRNPEVRQGEIVSKGQYTSAKTLEQLAEAIDTVVGGMWDIIGVGLQKLLAVCFEMDEKMWPSVEKQIHGVIRGQRFGTKYIPRKHIAGRRTLAVDYGFGVGGYQGFLQNVQAKEAQLLPAKRAMEQMPGITDVNDNVLELELERLDESVHANFLAQAQQGQLDVLLVMGLRREMEKKGKSLIEVIEKYEKKIKEQAEAAMQMGGAESLTAAPPPQEAAPPAPPGLPPLMGL